VNEPAAEPSRSDSRQRFYDWVKTMVIILVAGPPIGGFVFGLMFSLGSVLKGGVDNWEAVPATLLTTVALSHVFGLPIAVVAIALFLVLSRFISRGTSYLAVACGVMSAALAIALMEAMRQPVAAQFQLTWRDVVVQLAAFGIPSAVAGWACWRVTRPLHRLS
jgi:hypothetical protein